MTKIATKEMRPKENELSDARSSAKAKIPFSDSDLEKRLEGFPYEQSLFTTLQKGRPKFDRTGTGTIGIHGHESQFKMFKGFPLVTTKEVHLKSVIHELLWLIRGDTNIKYLADNNVTIWHDWPFKNWWQEVRNDTDQPFPRKGSTEWVTLKMQEEMKLFQHTIKQDSDFAKEWGELGPVYGKQWRDWDYFKYTPGYSVDTWDPERPGGKDWIPPEYEHCRIDQIQEIVDSINKQHETGVISRRMLVSAWNVGELPAMIEAGLPPCHCLFQFHSRLMSLEERRAYWAKKNGKGDEFTEKMDDDMLDAVEAPSYVLDLQLYQRSCDIFLGVPFNIASYSLLLLMMAQVTNCKPGTFIHDYGDLHIYANHLEQVAEQLSRKPRPYPTMKLNPDVKNIFDFTYEDFILEDYDPHPRIKGNVAV